MPPRKSFMGRQVVRESGYRSSLEESVGYDLSGKGVTFEYESLVIPFVPLQKVSRYTPDFILLSNGILVETKGYFKSEDRQKHKAVQQQYPDLDLRFLFPRPNNKLNKKSDTTYADWCDKHGFKWAAGKVIPKPWLDEPPNPKSLVLLETFRKKE